MKFVIATSSSIRIPGRLGSRYWRKYITTYIGEPDGDNSHVGPEGSGGWRNRILCKERTHIHPSIHPILGVKISIERGHAWRDEEKGSGDHHN
jgi:hypothetical protein